MLVIFNFKIEDPKLIRILRYAFNLKINGRILNAYLKIHTSMSECLLEICNLLNKKQLIMPSKKLNSVINSYNFYFVSDKLDFVDYPTIHQNIKESKISIINKYIYSNQNINFCYLIIAFEKTIFIINQTSLPLIQKIFTEEISIEFLSDSKDSFDKYFTKSYTEINFSPELTTEINELNEKLLFYNINPSLMNIWKIIKSCISTYLIIQSFQKLNRNRIEYFNNKRNSILENFEEEDFVILNTCGIGNSTVKLGYHIDKGELFAIKKFDKYDLVKLNLYQREKDNYLILNNHPLTPKFYGIIKGKTELIIEFIKGKTLYEFYKYELNEKIRIIFEILIIFEYLHRNHFVYRDLKPNNILIDQNKTPVLIDFDRMLKYDGSFNHILHTNDFSSAFIAPEVNDNNFSYECDIYSIGQMIYYIINEKSPNQDNLLNDFEKCIEMKQIYLNCTNKDVTKRPKISELILDFLLNFHSQIKIDNLYETFIDCFNNICDENSKENIQNLLKDQNNIEENYDSEQLVIEGLMYFQYAISDKSYASKAIYYLKMAADMNNSKAQYLLGTIYEKNIIVPPDIEQSIHYLKLASKNYFSEANVYLGFLYLNGIYFQRDINKSIHYLNLGASQKNARAFDFLGLLYSNGVYIEPDIDKAVNFFLGAAENGKYEAYFNIGCLYYDKKYNHFNIKKALYYFQKGVDHNVPAAQYIMGDIYYKGEYVSQDIKKALYLLTISANSCYDLALYKLGKIHMQGKFVPVNHEKAVYYFGVASKQNNSKALFYLGLYYKQYNFIDECLNFFTRSAEQNNSKALLVLGYMYYTGDCVKKNIDKSIDYFTKSANLNNVKAQAVLGEIYSDKNTSFHNNEKAIHYYTLSAENNFVTSQYCLGKYYFDTQSYEKAIYYFTKAADNNNLDAMVYLGTIYSCDIYVNHDIEKCLHYLTLASKQENPEAQFILGQIYLNGKYVQRDIEKGIYFYKRAANNNFMLAQFQLAMEYDKGMSVPHDIHQAIHYYKKAADKGHIHSQFYLGVIYSQGIGIQRNIQLGIYYYNLAGNQNHPIALYNLGDIYSEGKRVEKDMKKAINFYTLAAKVGNAKAQYNLGLIYEEGKETQRNIEKAIHYYTLSANNNLNESQFHLGLLYYDGKYGQRNVKKGLYNLFHAAQNMHVPANFVVGYLYHEGKDVDQDIETSIKCYKNASSFNDQYSKNNIGIIYKNGFSDKIKKNIGWAIEYFTEAIRQSNDAVAAYNLASIYLYEDSIENGIDKSIDLLIKFLDEGFGPSFELLCLALIKKNGFDHFDIKKFPQQITNDIELYRELLRVFLNRQLYIEKVFIETFNKFRNLDFLYTYQKDAISSNAIAIKKLISNKNNKRQNINSHFYEGFSS